MIAVIGCGARKKPFAAEAKNLYCGPYFKACLRAASRSVGQHRTFILSAKHGLLSLSKIIKPYDTKMGCPGAVRIEKLKEQADSLFSTSPIVLSFCGERYSRVLKQVFTDVRPQLQGRGGIGQQMAYLKKICSD